MWVNKLSAAVNAKHAKPTPSTGKKLLRNRDQEKKIELRMADKPEETSCTVLPVIDDILKGMCDGRCLLGILLFYEPTVVQIEGMILYIYIKRSVLRRQSRDTNRNIKRSNVSSIGPSSERKINKKSSEFT